MMIKPASALCNLACHYCFYLDTAAHRVEGSWPIMDQSVVEATVTKSLELADSVSFVFQGGEPTLAGLPFFESFVQTVAAHKRADQEIHYAFQTNGLIFDRSWARFFKEHDFLVGFSFDGTRKIHDVYRRDHSDEGSGRQVLRSIALAQEEGVTFNVLSVVTDLFAGNINAVHQFLTDRGIYHHQYISCMDPIDQDISFLSPKGYASFLKNSFDTWYHLFMRGTPISVRFFDNLVGMLLGLPPESCDMAGVCSPNYVVESNGNIYPCDFYCTDDMLLGNIVTDSFATLDTKRDELRFIEDSPNTIDGCERCRWQSLCRGGCKRYRTESGYRFCSSMQQFFDYAYDRLVQVAALVGRGEYEA